MATHSSTLAKKFHGWRSLVGYSPWGRKKTQLSNFTSLQSSVSGSVYSHFFETDSQNCGNLCHSCVPCGLDSKVSACNAGDLSWIPGSGSSPGEENGNPLQHSCLENPMDGGVWQAIVHGVAKSQTRLSDFTSLHLRCYNNTGNISYFVLSLLENQSITETSCPATAKS